MSVLADWLVRQAPSALHRRDLRPEQRRALHALLDALMPQAYALPQARRVRWSLDVDPVDLY